MGIRDIRSEWFPRVLVSSQDPGIGKFRGKRKCGCGACWM
jgi:hypothetical protein